MPEKDLNSKYTDLISRYLSGQTTKAEIEELESWVLATPENKARFKEMKRAWILSGMTEGKIKFDVEQNWHKVSGQIFQPEKVIRLKRNTTKRQWLRIAAAAAVIAICSVGFLLLLNSRNKDSIAAGENPEVMELPDGSTVNLNKSSLLEYAFSPDQPARKVTLDGDAFFEVARNARQPFRIAAGGIEIEVLGTAFYVDSRKDQPQVQVIVESGSVAVKAGREVVNLTKGEMASFLKAEQKLIKEQNTNENYKSFITHNLIFSGTPLEEVAFTLSRHFRANITVGSPNLADCPLSAKYVDKSLEATLNLIEASLNGVEAKRFEDGRIELRGARCE